MKMPPDGPMWRAGRRHARFQLCAQAHVAPHWHCAPQAQFGAQAQAFGSTCCWQPQAQPAPGQAVHWHWDWMAMVFMATLLSVGMRRQCRSAKQQWLE
jgi:hypothetical protein